MDHSDSDSRKRVDGRSSSRESGGPRVVSHRIDLLVPSYPSLHDAPPSRPPSCGPASGTEAQASS